MSRRSHVSREALVALALLLSLGSALAPASARAWCQMTTSNDAPTAAMPCVTDGEPLAWRTGCMAYAVDERGGIDLTAAQIEGVLDRSFRTWMSVTCDGASPGFDILGYVERATCQDAQYRGNRGNVNVVAMVSDWEERDYDPSAYAITTVWHNTDTGTILDVDVLVNEQLGPYAICPDTGCLPALPRNQVVDLENVLTHELGHFFGIAHSDIPNATMYLSAARGETLTLLQPNPTNASLAEVVIDKVRYESATPWNTNANNTGSSVQLMDPNQDNSRVGDWDARYVPAVYTPEISTPAVPRDGWRFFSVSGNVGTGDSVSSGDCP